MSDYLSPLTYYVADYRADITTPVLFALCAARDEFAGRGAAPDIASVEYFFTEGFAHLLIAELTLEDGDGIDLIRRVKVRWPATHCLLVTPDLTRAVVIRALAAGADGILAMPLNYDEMLHAARAARTNQTVLGATARQLLTEPVSTLTRPTPVPVTPTEREILHRLCHHQLPKQIAAELGRSEHTVRRHIKNCYAKYGVHRFSELRARFLADQGEAL
jgi:DNA-binding NarL/FixJ family response regulator